MLTLNDIAFSNKDFWTGFIATSFPTAIDEETDMSLPEIMEESNLGNAMWWKHFTKYYDGVIEESDGYIDDPETFTCNLTPAQRLKIEFHPGDTVYFINDKQIGCTGGEYCIQIFPFSNLSKYLDTEKDHRIFLLLLPLTVIDAQETESASKMISNVLKEIFEENLCNRFAQSIVSGLIAE